MREKKICSVCSKSLSKDEIALSQKILGRDISDFFCIECLAEYLECDREDLEVKIQEFKELGCALFI